MPKKSDKPKSKPKKMAKSKSTTKQKQKQSQTVNIKIGGTSKKSSTRRAPSSRGGGLVGSAPATSTVVYVPAMSQPTQNVDLGQLANLISMTHQTKPVASSLKTESPVREEIRNVKKDLPSNPILAESSNKPVTVLSDKPSSDIIYNDKPKFQSPKKRLIITEPDKSKLYSEMKLPLMPSINELAPSTVIESGDEVLPPRRIRSAPVQTEAPVLVSKKSFDTYSEQTPSLFSSGALPFENVESRDFVAPKDFKIKDAIQTIATFEKRSPKTVKAEYNKEKKENPSGVLAKYRKKAFEYQYQKRFDEL